MHIRRNKRYFRRKSLHRLIMQYTLALSNAAIIKALSIFKSNNCLFYEKHYQIKRKSKQANDFISSYNLYQIVHHQHSKQCKSECNLFKANELINSTEE